MTLRRLGVALPVVLVSEDHRVHRYRHIHSLWDKTLFLGYKNEFKNHINKVYIKWSNTIFNRPDLVHKTKPSQKYFYQRCLRYWIIYQTNDKRTILQRFLKFSCCVFSCDISQCEYITKISTMLFRVLLDYLEIQ